jgi:hypothetical protein
MFDEGVVPHHRRGDHQLRLADPKEVASRHGANVFEAQLPQRAEDQGVVGAQHPAHPVDDLRQRRDVEVIVVLV